MPLFVWLMVLLVGCAAGSSDEDNPRAVERSTRSGAAPADALERAADPFRSGSSYRLVVEIGKIEPGDESSSAELAISLKHRAGDDSEPLPVFTEEVEAGLDWVCGEEKHRGHVKAKMSGGDEVVKAELTGLPPLPRPNASIPCSVTAELETEGRDGERLLANGHSEFYIEEDVFYPDMQLHAVSVKLGDPSVVDLKVVLVRNWEVVKEGDPVFDDKVDVDLSWKCGNGDMSVSPQHPPPPTPNIIRISIGAGKSEATKSLNLPARPATLGEPGFTCMISAAAMISGYNLPIEGRKKIWITGRDLEVAVTEAVEDSAFGYVVTADDKELTENITLAISGCGVTFVDSTGAPLGDGTTVEDVSSRSDGEIFLSSNGTDCVLTATVGSGDTQRQRATAPFDVSPAPVQSISLRRN